MKKIIFVLFAFNLSNITLAATASQTVQTATGIAVDTEWKQQVYEYAKANVKHPSWGLTHSERNYQVSLTLADKEGLVIDRDVLFVASFLHDLGGIAPHDSPGVDHAMQSVQIIEPLLTQWGFPMEKFAQVKEMILGHTYYGPKPESQQAQAFRDADIIDFLGAIGVARIIAITQEGRMDGNLTSTVNILKNFTKTLPEKCSLQACKVMAEPRKKELDLFLLNLDTQSFGGKAL
ncbi:MAG: HD domain-containing protein [Bdellovibrionota bacterium]